MNLIRLTKQSILRRNGEDIRRNLKFRRAVAWTSHGGSDNSALWVFEESMCGKASRDDGKRTVRVRRLRMKLPEERVSPVEQRPNRSTVHCWRLPSKRQHSNPRAVVRVPIVALKSGNADGAKGGRKMNTQ